MLKRLCIISLSIITMASSCIITAMNKKNLSPDRCSICADVLYKKKRPTFKLECNHTFHTECIWKWVNEKIACPLCMDPSAVCFYYPDIKKLNDKVIKEIMNNQKFVIDSFHLLPPHIIKKILLSSGGISYDKSTHLSLENIPTQNNGFEIQPELNENVDIYSKPHVLTVMRGILALTIFFNLFFIYPKNISDELFIHKMITILLSSCGLAATFCYQKETRPGN